MALQAGRVGVAPDQVDIFGKIKAAGDMQEIVSAVKNALSADIPFLSGDWYKVHLTNDGTGYVLDIDKPNSGITATTGGLYPPANKFFAAFMVGAQGITKQGSESTTAQNVSYSFINALGKAYISIPAVDRRADIYIWVMLEDDV